MKKRYKIFIILAIITAPFLIAVMWYQHLQFSFIRQVEDGLLKLANNSTEMYKRIAQIEKDNDMCWSDGRVGITADDYIFYYDLHDSHGMDYIRDKNIFYLPDEKRFIISHKHFCVDLSHSNQPRNKAELLRRLDKAGPWE